MPTRAPAAVLAFLLCAPLAACSRGEDASPGVASAAPGEAAPSLLLLSIDTLRADRLGCYGAERDTSPAIDALAAEGALFETVLAPTSWTLPSHVSLLTGQGVLVHGVTRPFDRLDPKRRTLAEHLAAAGYRSAAFVSAPFLHANYGFARGFEVYRNFARGSAGSLPPARSAHSDQTGPAVIDAAIEWLENRPGTPFFLFVHLWDPHYDYVPPERLVRRFDPDYAGDLDPRGYERNPSIHAGMPPREISHLRALYDAEIRFTDAQIARLLEALRAGGLARDTIVSLASDHGEEFFEHGSKGHRKTLHEESVRVPWLVRFPSRIPPGRRLDGVVSLEDVAPTLLGLLGAPPLPEATGRDLSARLTGGDDGAIPERPALLALRSRVALRGPGYRIELDLATGAARHYDLERDPQAHSPRNAAVTAPEALATLRARLAAENAYAESLDWSVPDRAAIPESTREQLRELGYLDDDE